LSALLVSWALTNTYTVEEDAAGILAVEAYHSGIVRTLLYGLELEAPVNLISDARDSLDGSGADKDQGITVGTGGRANLVPTDADGLAYSRSYKEVLNIVYLTPGTGINKGGFYPSGLNGDLTVS